MKEMCVCCWWAFTTMTCCKTTWKNVISVPLAVSFTECFGSLRVLSTHIHLLQNSFASEDFVGNCSERDD